MAIDEFATCFANKVGADVDQVKNIGADGWKRLVDWWNGLSGPTKAVIGAIAAYGGTKLAALLGLAVGDMVAGGIVLFLGGASWEILISSAVDCSSQL
jgi:type IV secretory pathway VirB2 component (pilin)